MLSLIICSRTPKISDDLEKNIAETIGCEYELVVIDNSKNRYSIFSAYNEGVRRAKGNNLCFMHDDILYKTPNWGMQVEKKLEGESIGIVGVIGSYVMTKDYGYWDMMAPWVTGCVVVNEEGQIFNFDVYNDFTGGSSEVAMLDGMWLCCRRKIFEKISFDEQTYSGFHMYDMDICMQSLMFGYINVVIRNIDIRHYGNVCYSMSFCSGLESFHKKWNEKLPICRGLSVNKYLLDTFDLHLQYHYVFLHNSNRYWNSYLSISKSHAYKLGCFLLCPIYLIKKILNRLRCR